MDSQGDSATGSPRPRTLLRRLDQAAIAVILAVSLAVIVCSWSVRGGGQGGIIDIDRTDPMPISFQVDINAAGWTELSLLPNVGEVLAKRIVASREQDGPFAEHDDLQRVQGIGPKTLEGIRRYLLPLPRSEDVADR